MTATLGALDIIDLTGVAQPAITEPGIYRMSAAAYHADPVVGGSLSSTGARMLVPPAPPRKFDHYRRWGRPDNDAFRLGRAAHTVALGAGDLIVELPYKDWRTKDARSERDEHTAAGRTPLLPEEFEQVHLMAAELAEHPQAGPLLARPGESELVLVWRDRATGLWLRVMTDRLPDVAPGARRIMVDYKTCNDASPAGFARSMADFGYHIQAAFYLAALYALGLADGDAAPAFVLIAQEKAAPYLVAVHPVGPDALHWGRVLTRKALDVYRQCTATGRWPGYTDPDTDPAPLELPGWTVRQLDEAHARGEFDVDDDLSPAHFTTEER